MHRLHPCVALVAIGFCLALSGCADTAAGINSFVTEPFRRTPSTMVGIKTPKDRVKELRAMAKAGPRMDAAEQQHLVDRLTRELPQESDPWVRRQMVRTLAEFPQPGAEAAIVSCLNDGDIETRRTACSALGKRGGKTAVTELTRVVASDTSADVRMAAISAMGQTKDSTAVAPLAEALADADPAVQAHAQAALAQVSGRDYGNNVQAWREFAQTGKSETPELSYVEKLRRSFY